MTFATPALLLLLPIALLPLAWGWLRTRRRPSMAVADLGAVREATQLQAGWRVRLRFVPDLLRAVAVIALVIALARPREGLATALIPEEGIDIVVTLDASTSMEFAASGGVSRIEAAREVVEEFVGTLEGDRIGLVIFQSRSLALSPLTLDHRALTRTVRDVRVGLLPDGTAIGLGLAEALNLLRNSEAKSRVIVLLTDGQNNSGDISPTDAAQVAAALDIRVYTIGFVSRGTGQFADSGGVDETTLRRVAEITGGEYFDTATRDELADAYMAISDQERSRVGERRFTAFDEFAPWLAALALALLASEVTLRSTVLRRYPS